MPDASLLDECLGLCNLESRNAIKIAITAFAQVKEVALHPARLDWLRQSVDEELRSRQHSEHTPTACYLTKASGAHAS